MSSSISASTTGGWRKGESYELRYLWAPNHPNDYLEASFVAPGVIGYRYQPRTGIPVPAPAAVTQPMRDKIASLVNRLRQCIGKADQILAEFMSNPDNQSLVTYIKAAAWTTAVGVIVATIIEDFATMGAGLVDDWASFSLAYRIIRYVNKLP